MFRFLRNRNGSGPHDRFLSPPTFAAPHAEGSIYPVFEDLAGWVPGANSPFDDRAAVPCWPVLLLMQLDPPTHRLVCSALVNHPVPRLVEVVAQPGVIFAVLTDEVQLHVRPPLPAMRSRTSRLDNDLDVLRIASERQGQPALCLRDRQRRIILDFVGRAIVTDFVI